MAGPITWRNVDVNPIGEISRAMMSSQAGINAGFDNLSGVLKQQEAVDTANWNQQKSNNTNAFLNEMSKYTTPEAYQAALNSGELQASMAARGAQIDQAAARQALGAQMGILQERTVSGQKFLDGQLDREQAPIRDQIAALTAQGKSTEAKALLDQHTLRNEASLYKGNTEAERAMVLQGRADTTYNRGEELAKYTHPEAVQAAQDTAQMRNVSAMASAAHQAYALDAEKRSLEAGKIAKSLGLPVSISGSPLIEDMRTSDIAKLHDGMKKAGIENPETYLKGDTKAADSYFNSLAESGKYSPQVLAKLKDSIRAGFDSTGTGSVGVEALDNRRAAAENKVAYSNVADENWFTAGSPNAAKGYEQLATEVPNLIDKTSGYHSEEDVADMQKFVFTMATRGIEVEPGKFITPPVQLVRNAVRTAKGGWFTDAQRAGSAESILAESLKGVNIPKKLKEASEADAYFNKQKVKDALNSK